VTPPEFVISGSPVLFSESVRLEDFVLVHKLIMACISFSIVNHPKGGRG